MKKLLIIAIVLVGITSVAQEKKIRPERVQMEQMTPEQKNQLRLKKMTLALDLDASQQKEMSKIIAEQSSKKEARIAKRKASTDQAAKQRTTEERFTAQNQLLDDQIATKGQIKKILSNEQFKKWEDLQSKKKHNMHRRIANHSNHKSARMDAKK